MEKSGNTKFYFHSILSPPPKKQKKKNNNTKTKQQKQIYLKIRNQVTRI